MSTYYKASISMEDKIGIKTCDIHVQETRSLGKKTVFKQCISKGFFCLVASFKSRETPWKRVVRGHSGQAILSEIIDITLHCNGERVAAEENNGYSEPKRSKTNVTAIQMCLEMTSQSSLGDTLVLGLSKGPWDLQEKVWLLYPKGFSTYQGAGTSVRDSTGKALASLWARCLLLWDWTVGLSHLAKSG